ncbi:MAG: penicillin-binding protein 2 [Verrucomicrobiales bacterium]|nr:penicillin-binding protein 2 [Verrucomicrobiales bacterium]
MIKRRQQFIRALALLGLVVLAFVGLGFRLMDLQVWRHDELVKMAEKKSLQTTWHPAKRGDILDANGNQLATSVFVKTICADPTLIGGQQAIVARAIAPLLGMSGADLYQRLIPRVAKNSKGETVTNGLHYVRLQKNVTDETWQKIKTRMSQLTFGVDEKKLSKANRAFLRSLRQYAISAEPDQLRVYPNGPLAAHVLGFVGTLENTNHTSELFGYDGVEKFFDDKLRGASGWRVTGSDSRGKELVALRDEDVQAQGGLNVVLTIDAAIQHIVESALTNAAEKHAPQGITGIVMRPRTGEILAMASLPSFDPNNLRSINTNTEPNRVISDVMEPGSTFKTLVISGALNEKVVKLSDSVFCENGVFRYGGITLHDSEGHHFGNLTVQQVLQKSSNIGASKIGIQLQAPKLYEYMQDFGLGAFTGIPLPHEASASRYVHPLKGKYSIVQIPMGQGVAATRLQMAMAFGAIANGGVLMHPMLVKRLEDQNGNVVQRYEPQSVRRVVTESTAKQMIEALKTVVSKEGTAPLAAITNYTVAGKTGTAQKVVDGRYSSEKFVVSFIGFFPADNPELCISIVMDSAKEGGRAFGGALCGPVFSEIGKRCASYLNIPPDQISPPPAAAPAVVASAQTRNNMQTP